MTFVPSQATLTNLACSDLENLEVQLNYPYARSLELYGYTQVSQLFFKLDYHAIWAKKKAKVA